VEGQGKRLMIAAVLAFAVLFAWQALFPPEQPAPKTAAEEPVKSAPVVESPIGQTQVTASGQPVVQVQIPSAPEEEIKLQFAGIDVAFSNLGGGIRSWRLLDPKYGRDSHKGELIPTFAGSTAFQVNFAGSIVLPADAPWQGEKLSDRKVRYRVKTAEIEVIKTFEVTPENYLVTLRVDFHTTTDAKMALAISSFVYADPANEKARDGALAWKAACLRDGEIVQQRVGKLPLLQNAVKWAGFHHGYFLFAAAPRPTQNELVACNAYAAAEHAGLMRVDVVFPTATMKANDPPVSREVAAYLGPTHYHDLESADEVAGFSTGFKEVTDFGWFGVIGKPLLWLLHTFYGWAGNWGIAIVMLTILVKMATIYWTTQSMRSMKSMAVLAPKMKEIQEKYPEDRQKQQIETMALYKRHGVNPLAGCLPILLQMPIWLALYRMLSSAGELYLERLVPGWIDDLTATDPFHVLPVVLIVTMFGQARLTPSTGSGFQQKLLLYGLPLGFGIASFFFPSGLTLYILTNTVLSALHSIYMMKFDKPSLALVAAAERAAKASTVSGTIDVSEPEVSDSSPEKASGSPRAARAQKPRKSRN
jgi:YidC/Oxa1 family membrane protein insertase